MILPPPSVFSTPGRRSYGNAGVLGPDHEYAGMQQALKSVTEFGEDVYFPLFGYLTSSEVRLARTW